MEDEGEALPARPRRWRRALLALLVILAVALAGLWLARKPLATRYADDFLASKQVPARYAIADLGLGRQRLVNVVLGDPANPDLVADWLEARTAIGLSGPYLTGVRGGHVRVRARWKDGELSLGSLDRLLPKGEGGKPFTMPALTLDVDDLRARVETPWGPIGAKLTGRGPLDAGFDGRLAVTSTRLGTGCAATAPRLAARITTRRDGVRLDGSGELTGARCGGVTTGYANTNGQVDIALGVAPHWQVTADLAAQRLRHPRLTAAGATGHVTLEGGAGSIHGPIRLVAQDVDGGRATARAVTVEGNAALGGAEPGAFNYGGAVSWQGARVRGIAIGEQAQADGTPVGPLLRKIAAAADRAAARFDGHAALVLAIAKAGSSLRFFDAGATAASGASASYVADGGPQWRGGALRLTGEVQIGGGGLPAARVRFAPAAPRAVAGTAIVQPYAAPGARVALTPVRFAYDRAGWRVATRATLSGPLADGRVEALTLPIDARGAGGAITLAGGCVPMGWQRLAVSGLVLDPATVRLCPAAGALLAVAGGRASGGATLAATRLTGRLGGTPLTLATTAARFALAGRRFALTGVAARLGRPGRETLLAAKQLDGAIGPAGIAGTFAGAGGRIGAVPLVMADAAGRWRFARGTLGVDGGLTVSDAQTDRPRLKPLPVRDVALTLRGNAIDAAGTLRSPDQARTLATIRLTHDLRAGAGNARFSVPGLVFDKALQPDQLTPVTFGVIADVRGTVTGSGAIDWTPAGVTSTGRFTTEGTDLAAAFGPVQGIAGTIAFTDLLALESAPGQRFTVREVNPGMAVTDGTVTFQTLPNARVAVAGARWPFAGGMLTLEPTLLDFGEAAQRRLTFRVDGAAADQFLQQFDFQNLNATGTFDGVLPMVFDANGGRIENGHLTVRPGGGTIAYVGAISQKDVGFWGNLAFQALKSLRYRSLNIVMNGPLAGEMVTEVRFAGVSQGEGAAKGGIAGLLVGRLQRLPFVFNIRIRAPFRGLLDATASFYDPRRLIQRNLPQLIEEQNRRAPPPRGGNQAPPVKPIQPPASGTVP